MNSMVTNRGTWELFAMPHDDPRVPSMVRTLAGISVTVGFKVEVYEALCVEGSPAPLKAAGWVVYMPEAEEGGLLFGLDPRPEAEQHIIRGTTALLALAMFLNAVEG